MNAKTILKLLARHAADARQCYPSDEQKRSMYFAFALGNDLTRHEELVGAQIKALMQHETNTPAPKGVMP